MTVYKRADGVTIYTQDDSTDPTLDCRSCLFNNPQGICLISEKKRKAGDNCEFGLTADKARAFKGDDQAIPAFLREISR